MWHVLSHTRSHKCPISFYTTVILDTYFYLQESMSHINDQELPFCYSEEAVAVYHTSEWPLEEIKDLSGNTNISKGLWLHQSPDMTLLDFFLWGLEEGVLK